MVTATAVKATARAATAQPFPGHLQILWLRRVVKVLTALVAMITRTFVVGPPMGIVVQRRDIAGSHITIALMYWAGKLVEDHLNISCADSTH